MGNWKRLFLTLLAGITLSWATGGAAVDFSPDNTARITLRSRLEGQFIVKGVPFPPSITPSREGNVRTFMPNTSRDWPASVRLDPSTVVVVCERVKQIFLQELELQDQWKGLIEIDIDFYPKGVLRPIMLSHRLMNDGLHTQMKMADEVVPHRLIQAIVQVLLLEYSNRDLRQTQMAEVPLWMIDGMTQLIMQRGGPALIPTPGAPKDFSTVTTNPAKAAKSRLKTIQPPEFSQITSPGPEFSSGVNWMIFQDACLVLTWELLERPEGKIRYCRTLQLLKKYRNWQLAFLEAWKGQFKNMTDVEKWWALVLVNCRKDTSMNAWTLKQSIEKLNEILSEASVSVISQINQPKIPSTIHLQQIAESWAPMVQIYFFERVAAQLKAFELAADPVVADLASRYRTTIIDYIRQPRIYAFFGKDAPSRADLRVLKKRLNYLDNEREQLQEKANATPEEPDKYLENENEGTPAEQNEQP
ncbi:MAG: hypothetical protein IK033_01795 [Verrucomicrobia bacterium]|nr:hypothetical protein [Verrucomicrobiota bacterium]